eukprot:TRINITY_DN46764_c0_g1_i1.p1 TRINITY_DN46764_c0_g1~~TRINITY_DN46764_c0_g1_i1.p1  ORF type:complete len:673 (+),score=342.97 TRINITY_DN46764_c0_g1_i1:39-2057(+)
MKSEKPGWWVRFQPLWVLLTTLLYAMHGILLTAARGTQRHYPFDITLLVLLSEVIKFSLSLMLVWREMTGRGHAPVFKVRVFLWLCVPGLLYAVNNNLNFIVLEYMDPATYQLMSNLKIVTTALGAYFFLRQDIDLLQRLAIMFLVVGCAMQSNMDDDMPANAVGTTWYGVVIMVIHCCISAAAGLVTEYAMKSDNDNSINFQNVQLYASGVVFNMMILFWSRHRAVVHPAGQLHDTQPVVMHKVSGNMAEPSLWRGMNWLFIVILLDQSFMGLFFSAIMKYLDNIVRLYTLAGGSCIALLASVFLFKLSLTIPFVLSIFVIGGSMYLYNLDHFAGAAGNGHDDSRGRQRSRRTSAKSAGSIADQDDGAADGDDERTGLLQHARDAEAGGGKSFDVDDDDLLSDDDIDFGTRHGDDGKQSNGKLRSSSKRSAGKRERTAGEACKALLIIVGFCVIMWGTAHMSHKTAASKRGYCQCALDVHQGLVSRQIVNGKVRKTTMSPLQEQSVADLCFYHHHNKHNDHNHDKNIVNGVFDSRIDPDTEAKMAAKNAPHLKSGAGGSTSVASSGPAPPPAAPLPLNDAVQFGAAGGDQSSKPHVFEDQVSGAPPAAPGAGDADAPGAGDSAQPLPPPPLPEPVASTASNDASVGVPAATGAAVPVSHTPPPMFGSDSSS